MDDRQTEGRLLSDDELWSSAFGPPPGGQGVDGRIRAMIPFRDSLVVGGDFNLAGKRSVRNIASWDGSTWTPMGDRFTKSVDCFCIHEGELVAGGRLQVEDDCDFGVIGVWDGSEWRMLGEGFHGEVRALAVFRGNLIAALRPKIPVIWKKISLFGLHLGSTGVPDPDVSPNSLWVWNGYRWAEFEGGLEGDINHIMVQEDRLLIAGELKACKGGREETFLEWDGTEWLVWPWRALDPPSRMIDHEGTLVVGGAFDYMGCMWDGACFVMEWTGEQWQDLGVRPDLAVEALETHKGELLAVGHFRAIGDEPARNIARWDGVKWHSLGSGIESEFIVSARSAVSYGDHLYVGGNFHKAGGKTLSKYRMLAGVGWIRGELRGSPAKGNEVVDLTLQVS